MTDLELKQYKDKLLTILTKFIEICEEHNLSYFCACGTVIGAIRHKGYIPWDDDIDVYMPQEDYYKFLQIGCNYEGYETISIHDSKHLATFAKFYDSNTTLWELKQIPFVYGVYIDVFPLYTTSGDKDAFFKSYTKLRKLQRKYQMAQFKPSFSDIISSVRNKNKKMIIKNIVSLFVPSFMSGLYRKEIIVFEKIVTEMENDGQYYASYYGDYWRKELFEKKWFEEYVEVPFENISVRVCKGYEEYLGHLYGDYMKLPPVDKQITHHYHYYMDLKKSYSLENLRKL